MPDKLHRRGKQARDHGKKDRNGPDGIDHDPDRQELLEQQGPIHDTSPPDSGATSAYLKVGRWAPS